MHDVRRRAGFHLDEITDHRPQRGVDAPLQEATVRLRAKQRFAVMQLIPRTMLYHHAGDAQSGFRKRITAPADTAQAFDRLGVTHGRSVCTVLPIMPRTGVVWATGARVRTPCGRC
jgi:hypothetical protein